MNYHACEIGGNSFVMKDNLGYMLKKVIIYWLMVTTTLGILTYLIFPKYTSVFILGLFIALSNFIINTTITKFLLLTTNGKYLFLASISTTLRILIICVIGLILFTYDRFNVIAYMGGFCSYLICLVLYGINLNK
jgi:ATP synthase protein I